MIEGRFVRTAFGLVVGVTDVAQIVIGHVLPGVDKIKSQICAVPGFTMEELYFHAGMMIAAILLIHPQSLRELPALISSLIPFGKGKAS